MRVILLGPPGSGKGTQGDLLTRTFGFPRISTGDLLRAAVQAETPIGLKAKAVMDRGALVSDDIVNALIKDRIFHDDCREGYILDGYPRTIFQAETLDSFEPGRDEVAVDIRVSDEAVVKRLSSRRVCSGCHRVYNVKNTENKAVCPACGGDFFQRSDDTPDVIRKRLHVYMEETAPLIAYYISKGDYFAVDGERDIASVFEDVAAILTKARGNIGIREGIS